MTLEDWVPFVDLCNLPGGGKAIREVDDLKVIGRLNKGDVALVVHVSNRGGDIYLHGSGGSGWTFGAWLKVMVSSAQA